MISRQSFPASPFRHHGESRAVNASPLPRGEVLERILVGDARQRYFIYLPESCDEHTRVMVSVHGISRNAEEHVSAFTAFSERHNLMLVAPLFNAERFRDYQRLGRAGRGPRADLALERILREATELTGIDCERFFLFGFSGGGQFAHRYTFAHPHRVIALIVGAAGWYTFPDRHRAYPKGTAESEVLPGVIFDSRRYLQVPACVLVGEGDIDRDDELKKAARLDREQGCNRVERGRSWIASMRAEAGRLGLQTRYRFELLPDCGHSFLDGHRSNHLCDHMSRFLFGR